VQACPLAENNTQLSVEHSSARLYRCAMEDLEDDIEIELDAAPVADQPRKLSRLKKASLTKPGVAKVDTPEAEGRSSLAQGASSDDEEEHAAADSPSPGREMVSCCLNIGRFVCFSHQVYI